MVGKDVQDSFYVLCWVRWLLVARPEILGIIACMDQKDSIPRVWCAHRRLWQWHVHRWFCRYFCPRAVVLSVVVRPKKLGIMASMNQKDRYVARLLFTRPLCATTGAVGFDENCGFSAVAAHFHGHQHPCHDAEADFHGPGCLFDHRDSLVAL